MEQVIAITTTTTTTVILLPTRTPPINQNKRRKRREHVTKKTWLLLMFLSHTADDDEDESKHDPYHFLKPRSRGYCKSHSVVPYAKALVQALKSSKKKNSDDKAWKPPKK